MKSLLFSVIIALICIFIIESNSSSTCDSSGTGTACAQTVESASCDIKCRRFENCSARGAYQDQYPRNWINVSDAQCVGVAVGTKGECSCDPKNSTSVCGQKTFENGTYWCRHFKNCTTFKDNVNNFTYTNRVSCSDISVGSAGVCSIC